MIIEIEIVEIETGSNTTLWAVLLKTASIIAEQEIAKSLSCITIVRVPGMLVVVRVWTMCS